MGKRWWKQQATVHTTSGGFQLAIEAIRGSGYNGDISLDDIMVLDGTCPLQSK